MFQDTWTHLQFALRKNVFGKIRVRSSLPVPQLTQGIQKERQFYHFVLSRALASEEKGSWKQVVDVGCRNWSYAQAIAEFFPNANLWGIEVDGNRRYLNLYRRMDFARTYAEELRSESRDVQFWHGDFENFNELQASKDTLFCFFYPFVSENPCLKWGLPTRFVKFSNLLRHALEISSKEGSPRTGILTLHQGEWEAEISRRAFREVGLSFEEKVLKVEEFEEFWPSQHNAHLLYSHLASK